MAIRTGVQKSTKVTFSLPVELMEAVRQLVQEGAAPSQSVLVSKALENEIRNRRRAQLREEFHRAAVDPDFLRDIEDTMHDFAAADVETARMIL